MAMTGASFREITKHGCSPSIIKQPPMNLVNKRLYSFIGYVLVSWGGLIAGLDALFLQLRNCFSIDLANQSLKLLCGLKIFFLCGGSQHPRIDGFQQFGSYLMSIFIYLQFLWLCGLCSPGFQPSEVLFNA